MGKGKNALLNRWQLWIAQWFPNRAAQCNRFVASGTNLCSTVRFICFVGHFCPDARFKENWFHPWLSGLKRPSIFTNSKIFVSIYDKSTVGCFKCLLFWGNNIIWQKMTFKERPVSCHICDKPFIDNKSVRIHVRSVHMKEKPHLCPSCGKGKVIIFKSFFFSDSSTICLFSCNLQPIFTFLFMLSKCLGFVGAVSFFLSDPNYYCHFDNSVAKCLHLRPYDERFCSNFWFKIVLDHA